MTAIEIYVFPCHFSCTFCNESPMHVCVLVTASILIKHYNGDTCALHAYILF